MPQRDATSTATLRGGGAISRLMSCAQFPPDNKLCLLAASALSIASEGTSATNRRSPLVACRLPGGVLCSLAAAKSSARFGCRTLHRIHIRAQIYEVLRRLRFSQQHLSRRARSGSALGSNSSSGSWVTSTSEVFPGPPAQAGRGGRGRGALQTGERVSLASRWSSPSRN